MGRERPPSGGLFFYSGLLGMIREVEMGSFSIWHWIIVLLIIGVPIGIVWFAVTKTRKK